ncbi:MFS general substrate transporter [Lactarius pseudohatsudake]|nr:MFS general substrate transporter [Lactarius pseudohatsudake]
MAASLVTNTSHSHSPSSATIIAASSSPVVHSPTSTVLRNHDSAVLSETECNDGRIGAYGASDSSQNHQLKESSTSQLPFLSKSNTDPNLVTWDGLDDPANPQNWSFGYKLWLTAVGNLMTFCCTFASSAPSSSTATIADEFHVGREVGNLILTLFLVGFTVGPSFWGPGSELIGRRPISISTFALYILLNIGQVRANSMTTLLVTRFLCGFFAAAPLTNSIGIIADLWDPMNRGIAMSVFTATALLGPGTGPVIGSFTSSSLGWRWVFLVIIIFAGACILLSFFVPETYAPVLLARKANHLRAADPVKNKDIYAESERVSWALNAVLERTIFRPFKMLLVEPILLLTTIYVALAYGVMYAMFEAVPLIFIDTRHFSVSSDGLIFIGIGIGAILATVVSLWFLRPYPRLLEQWHGFPPVEERLYSAMVGGPTLVIGILMLGWSGNYESVPWWVPGLSTILIGLAIALIFISFQTYLVDTYLKYAASALAAHTIIRSLAGAAFPLFSTQMFVKLGINWAGTLLGGIALILAPIPFLFYKYGQRIRTNSGFAPCLDLKVAEFLKEDHLAAAQTARQTV